jgi:hypothetical protein
MDPTKITRSPLPSPPRMNSDDEPRYTPSEIAERLGKPGKGGRKFVLEEIRRGRMDCYDLSRKCKRISESQYRDYLESRRIRTVDSGVSDPPPSDPVTD